MVDHDDAHFLLVVASFPMLCVNLCALSLGYIWDDVGLTRSNAIDCTGSRCVEVWDLQVPEEIHILCRTDLEATKIRALSFQRSDLPPRYMRSRSHTQRPA